MPCDTKLKTNQSIASRADEIRAATAKLAEGLASGRMKAVVGPQGAVAFTGLSDADRNGMTDACAYRRIMAGQSAMAKQAIARAEQLSGRSVNRQVIGQGTHSHDGGTTWHGKG